MDNLIEVDRKNIWHPFTPLINDEKPILIEKGEGIYLYSSDGQKIIDAVSSWWVNLHGHGHPLIAKAIAEQASTLEHVIFAGFTHKPAIALSENLLSILPDNQSKIFFSDNGSTAVEVALKMALQFWHNNGITSKKKIVAIRGAYHGDTFGSMAVGERGPFTDAFSSYLFDVSFIDFPTNNNEHIVLEQFRTLLEKDDVGAFIFEPLVQAAAGMRMYSPTFLDQLISEAKIHNVICIADEVFTGFGRTGKMFASHYLKNRPDIVAMSKGITGGTLPLGVTTCSADVVSAFNSNKVEKTFFHGHSYTANPLACAAANMSFRLLTDESCQQRIKKIERHHLLFKQRIQSSSKVTEVRCLGTILAIELLSSDGTSYFNDMRKMIYPYFLKKDILLRPLGNVIYLLPPYIIEAHELNYVYGCIETFLNEI